MLVRVPFQLDMFHLPLALSSGGSTISMSTCHGSHLTKTTDMIRDGRTDTLTVATMVDLLGVPGCPRVRLFPCVLFLSADFTMMWKTMARWRAP